MVNRSKDCARQPMFGYLHQGLVADSQVEVIEQELTGRRDSSPHRRPGLARPLDRPSHHSSLSEFPAPRVYLAA